jgi:hypothetical protein
LPNTGTSGTYAYPSSIATDAQGRVSSISAGPPNPFLGNGCDGAVTLDGVATVPWATLSGSTYTATRVPFCSSSLTVNSGVTLTLYGVVSSVGLVFPICCQGAIVNNGTIEANGAPGIGMVPGGDGVTSDSFGLGGGGGAGFSVASAGGNGTGNPAIAFGGSGGNGGAGGAQAGGAGGTNASDSVNAPHDVSYKYSFQLLTLVLPYPSATALYVNGGAGGGGGGCDSANAQSGAGGMGGNPLLICARTITNNGVISSKGGRGADAVTNGTGVGNAGGGGGGQGGPVIIYCGTYSGTDPDVSGGAGGAGFGSMGTAGSTGGDGQVIWFCNNKTASAYQ